MISVSAVVPAALQAPRFSQEAQIGSDFSARLIANGVSQNCRYNFWGPHSQDYSMLGNVEAIYSDLPGWENFQIY